MKWRLHGRSRDRSGLRGGSVNRNMQREIMPPCATVLLPSAETQARSEMSGRSLLLSQQREAKRLQSINRKGQSRDWWHQKPRRIFHIWHLPSRNHSSFNISGRTNESHGGAAPAQAPHSRGASTLLHLGRPSSTRPITVIIWWEARTKPSGGMQVAIRDGPSWWCRINTLACVCRRVAARSCPQSNRS